MQHLQSTEKLFSELAGQIRQSVGQMRHFEEMRNNHSENGTHYFEEI